MRLAMVTQMYYISIHVPREGDDVNPLTWKKLESYFNPRPP